MAVFRVAVRPALGHAALPSPRAKRGETMHHDLRSEFEVFLVEDVILTLGNLRGSLSWLGTSQSADPAIFRAGLDRLDRQIGMLEDRARALKRQMDTAATDAESGRTMPIATTGHPQDGIGPDDMAAAPYDDAARYAPDEPAGEALVDLEIGPDLPASSGLDADTRHGAMPEPDVQVEVADGLAIPEPPDPLSMRVSPTEHEPVSLPLANPAQPASNADGDGDDLNIFGSDPDLSPDPFRSLSPVPFRSRRSAR
jgi:hypothetical protein